MAKIKYSKSVFDSTQRTQLKKEIMTAAESAPELRKEIARVFQQANRRIQNIEKAGLLSPAVSAIHKGDGYTKFGMRLPWNDLKTEYARAVQFLRQPTSTASGTRQYNEHIMREYGLSKDEFALMANQINGKLQSVDDTEFVEKYLMRYKDFTGELEQSARDISAQLESDAVQLTNALDEAIEQAAEDVTDQIDATLKDLLDAFDNFDEF